MNPYLIPLLFVAGCSEPVQAPVQAEQATVEDPALPQAMQTEHQGMPRLSTLADSWNTIRPGGETTCLYGTEYGFFRETRIHKPSAHHIPRWWRMLVGTDLQRRASRSDG